MSAIFGPEDVSSAIHAANICDTKDIPYIDTRYDAFSMMPVVNMYPAAASLAKMITDLVIAAEWKSFTILYEQPIWLPRVAELLQLYDPKGYTITIRRIDLGLPVKNYRAMLRRVKMSSDHCIIIECSAESLVEVLKQAQQIGIMIDKYHYIITNLDAQTIDLEPYQYSGANITVLRMVDTSSPILVNYAEYLKNLPLPAEEDEEKKEGEGEGDGEEKTEEEAPPPEPEEDAPKEGEEEEEEKPKGDDEEEEDNEDEDGGEEERKEEENNPPADGNETPGLYKFLL